MGRSSASPLDPPRRPAHAPRIHVQVLGRKDRPNVPVKTQELTSELVFIVTHVEAINMFRHRPFESESLYAIGNAINNPATDPPSVEVRSLKRHEIVASFEDWLISHQLALVWSRHALVVIPS